MDPKGQNPVLHGCHGVTEHGEVGKVDPGLLHKAVAFGAFHRGHAAAFHRLGTLAEPLHHRLGVKSGHARTV